MRKVSRSQPDQDMLPEYDFSQGVRGKYAARYAKGSNLVLLDPEVARVFRDAKSVNQALRALADIIQLRSKKRPA